MLLHAVKREPRISIVPDAHPVNVPMPPVSPPRLVRDALVADAIVAVAPWNDAVAADLRTLANRLACFRQAQSHPDLRHFQRRSPGRSRRWSGRATV